MVPFKFKILPVSLLLVILFTGGIFAQSFTRITGQPPNLDTRSTRGASWGDYDNDGDPDLFISVDDTTNYLYRNEGGGIFTQMASGEVGSLVVDAGSSSGATWGDADNDGDLDLFVANRFEANLLYQNNGDGTFTRITSGLIVTEVIDSRGASWADYDQDGYLDLYVANKGGLNNLYHNNGDGSLSFSKITTGAIVNEFERSGTANWGDYDNDGDLDLFVANDDDGSDENNSLYRNEGGLSFTEITDQPLVTDGGESESAAWADYDNDGDLDLFVANDGVDGDQNNFFYINNGDGSFTKVTGINIVADGGDSEDCAWADFDNDGDLDLFVANNDGQNNFLYENLGNGTFAAVSGINVVTDGGESEGCVWADFDNDGDMDLIVANDDMENFLYQNNGNGNNYLKVQLTGTVSNTAAIGARIRLRAVPDGGEAFWQMREVLAQASAKGQEPLTQHFGLSTADQVDSIIVNWPSGLRDTLTNQSVNQLLEIEEGSDPGSPPGMPGNLLAAATSSSQIDLNWQASSGDPQRYFIYRSTVSGAVGTLIDSINAAFVNYADTDLNAQTTYYYQVSAGNSSGRSPLSNEATATTFGLPPGTPSGVTATAISSSEINVTWDIAVTAVEEYYIYRSATSGTGFVLYDSLTAPATIYVDDGLPFSTQYFYRINARNQWGQSSQSTEVSATTFGIAPSAPTNLSAATVSAAQIDLSWDASLNSPVQYLIYRSQTSGGTLTLIDSVDHPTTGYSDSGLAALSDYFYKIVAQNEWGASAFSGEATATTFGLPPATPGGLNAQAISAQSVQLNWTISSDEVSRYRIYRAIGAGAFTLIDSVDHPVNSYLNEGLIPETVYSYQISAVNQWGQSPLTASVSATTPGHPPTAPSGATAVATAATQIDLSWTASLQTPLRYRIYRSLTSGGGFAVIDSVDHPQATFSDVALSPLTSYYYQISAVNEWGESPLSSEISATTPPVGAPSTPGSLVATAAGYGEIDLSWLASSGNPLRYRVYRSLTGINNDFVLIDSVSHPAVSFQDNNLDSSTVHYYQVSAVNAVGASAVSLADSAITFGKPFRPQGLSATTLTFDQIELQWNSSPANVRSQNIYRAVGSSTTFTLIDSIAVPDTIFVDSLLLPLTEHRYYIRAQNRFGFSVDSDTAVATTLGRAPSIPENGVVTAVSPTSVELEWSPSNFGPEVYRLYRSPQSGSGFVLIDSTLHPDTVYTNSGLEPETDYFYYLTARNEWGTSPRTPEITARTTGIAPPIPANPAAVALSSTEIEVRWDSLSGGADRYLVYRSLTTGGGFSLLDSVDHPQLVFVDSNLTASTAYFYKISAVNQWGASELSAEATATTANPGAPGAPNLLNAVAAGFTLINLNWQASQFGDPQYYRVYRSLQRDSAFSAIDSVDSPTTTYLDDGLDTTTTYFYQVRAVNQGGDSPPSNVDSATTFGPPLQPVLLNANALSQTEIQLQWQAPAGSPTRYRIYRGFQLSTLALIDSIDVPAITYLDTALQQQTTYVYRISAVNQWGESSYSDTVQATTASPGFPSAPANLIAGTVSTKEILLRWDISTQDPLRYRIYQAATIDGPYLQIDSVNHPINTYLNGELIPSTEYWYRVSAVNDAGESPFSNIAESRTFGPPSVPRQVSAQAVSNEQVDLSWMSSDGDPLRYRVYRADDSAMAFTLIDSVNHPVTSYSERGLTAATQYYYFVTALNQWGESDSSQVDSTTTGGELAAPAIISGQLTIQPALPSEGQSINIFVPIEGEQLQVTLFYGMGSDLQTASVITMQSSGGFYQATIPGNAVTAEGVWYRIMAANTAGTASYPALQPFEDINVRVTGFAAIEADGAFPEGLPADGWNTVSLPFAAENPLSFESLFGSQTFNNRGEPLNWAAYRYNNGQFQQVASLVPGDAAFVYHRNDSPVKIAPTNGVSNDLNDFFATMLQPGWNLVSWPYAFPQILQVLDNAAVGSVWFQKEGNWMRLTGAAPQTLKPFAAVAIYNKTANPLPIGGAIAVDSTKALGRIAGSESSWSIGIGVSAGRLFDYGNLAIVYKGGKHGSDELDEPEPLAAGKGLSLHFINREFTNLLASDARGADAAGHQWELILENPEQQKSLRFSWDLAFLPEEKDAVLIDIDRNRTVDISGEGRNGYSVAAPGKRSRYILIAGSRDYVVEQRDKVLGGLPSDFLLRQNYPNPFNGRTTVAFDVARSGRVRIDVFNILGQRVKVLSDQPRETGRYRLVWDGRNDSGNPVSSGMYLIRMQAAAWQKTIRTVYVR